MSKYVVNNDEVLCLIDKWKFAEHKEKIVIENKIINDLSFLVYSRLKTHRGSELYADLCQEGKMGLMRALKDFEPSRGKNFFLFATWHIQTRIRRLLIKESKRKEIPVGDFNEEHIGTIELKESECDVKHIINSLDKLPNKSQKVIQMHFGFNGMEPQSFQQIGRELGISRQRAQQIGVSAIKKLQHTITKKLYCKEEI
jgi:RNA polymerase sigma factor (sigma-70 family)